MADAFERTESYRRIMSRDATSMITLARRTQEWLRSRPRLVDLFLAVLFGMLAMAELVGEVEVEGKREPDALGFLLILIGASALAWRRVRPITALTFVVGVSCVFYVLDYKSFMSSVGLAGLYAVAAHANNRRTAWMALGAASVILVVLASFTVLNHDGRYQWSGAVSMSLTVGATIVVGAIFRNKEEIFADTRERANRAEAEQKAEAERAVTRERLRIAREMHDVVAHGMSLITVQAAAAQEVARTRPDDAARLMHSVESTGRDALAEMRRMLGVLRNDDPADASGNHSELSPQPTLDDLETVIAHCIDAGTPTELSISGNQRSLPPGIELAAFRIVQEALTNVIKHAGDAATASVELTYDADELHIIIGDTGRGAVSELTSTGSGHGHIGMRERVEIYNGKLTAGPRPGGGYQVDVSLPITDTPDAALELPEREGTVAP